MPTVKRYFNVYNMLANVDKLDFWSHVGDNFCALALPRPRCTVRDSFPRRSCTENRVMLVIVLIFPP